MENGKKEFDSKNFSKDEKKYALEKEAMDIKSPEELSKEARITKEDLEALGPKNLSMDMQDDEDLKHRTHQVDFEGKDLDIPGRDFDDENEDIGAEDEENNHYSLGSEDNERLDRGIDDEK